MQQGVNKKNEKNRIMNSILDLNYWIIYTQPSIIIKYNWVSIVNNKKWFLNS